MDGIIPEFPGERGRRGEVAVEPADVVVLGSGLAGLTAALRLAPARVTLLTKTAGLAGGSSLWAQGGIAAAVGADDSAAEHAADTRAAGAGLVDGAMADLLARDGIACVNDLLDRGLPFDRDETGRPLLGREAAHGQSRIVHAGGDATGRTLIEALSDIVRRAPSVAVEAGAFAWDLVVVRGRIAGVLAHHADRGWVLHRTARVILATGGIGQCWAYTTNPAEATADGLAMAARAGAELMDLEFMQFHPTALAAGQAGGQRPLLTEALRGAGAHLLDAAGHRFMPDEHPLAELAPRDIVARAIGRRVAAGEAVFLDLRALWAAGGAGRFPTVAAICATAGLDPATQPIPVAPAAHYHMGGVRTDRDGRTSVPGLWACGEVACTGVHGANRLASNSLLEALVFAGRVADDVRAAGPGVPLPVALPTAPAVPGGSKAAAGRLAAEAQEVMVRHVSLRRDAYGLAEAQERLARLDAQAAALPVLRPAGAADIRRVGELRNRLLADRLVARAAAARTESRGAHARDDFPETRKAWLRHQVLTVADLDGARQGALALAVPAE